MTNTGRVRPETMRFAVSGTANALVAARRTRDPARRAKRRCMGPKLEAARAATKDGTCDAAYIAQWNGAGTLTALLEGKGTGTKVLEGVAHD